MTDKKREQELEDELIQHGTAKRKSDLLKDTGISPLKMAAAVKKFGEPIPEELSGVEEYVGDLFDFVLETEPEFYGQFKEADLNLDLFRYICGEVWSRKHKARKIVTPRCAVTMDIRKYFKDAVSAHAQTVGHLLKHSSREELVDMNKSELRQMLIDATEEALEEVLGAPLLEMWAGRRALMLEKHGGGEVTA